MAYQYEGSAETSKGTIIYKRKRHYFGPKDLWRVANAVEWPFHPDNCLTYIGVFELLFNRIPFEEPDTDEDWRALVSEAIQLTVKEYQDAGGEFGGGGSSGGGATGNF